MRKFVLHSAKIKCSSKTVGNRTFTTFAAALYAVSVLPGAQAYCYYDQFGRRHCTLSTGARIGIAIAAGEFSWSYRSYVRNLTSPPAAIGLMLIIYAFIRLFRQRSARRNANLAYVNTSGVAGTVPPGPPPPGYAPQGGYYPQGYGGPSPYNGGYAPQYPPQTYNAQSPYPSVSQSRYAGLSLLAADPPSSPSRLLPVVIMRRHKAHRRILMLTRNMRLLPDHRRSRRSIN